MMKMIRANWVDLAQGCGVVAGIFLAIHLITAGVLFWGHPDSSVTISGIALPAAAGLMILVVTATYLATPLTKCALQPDTPPALGC